MLSSKEGLILEKQYREAIHEVDVETNPSEQEIVVLKRQKKIVAEDLEDQLPAYTKLEDAYASVIISKVMGAVAKQGKKKFKQSEFKSNVLEYYGASRIVGKGNDRQACCHLTGWQPDSLVKAAHSAQIAAVG